MSPPPPPEDTRPLPSPAAADLAALGPAQIGTDSRVNWEWVIEAAGLGLWDFDLISGTRRFSPHWCQIRGLTEAEVREMTDAAWLARVHPDDRSMAAQLVARILAGNHAEIAIEYREQHRKGHWIWVMCRGRVVETDLNGRPTRIAGVDTDITRMKAAEEERRAFAKQLRIALSAADIGVWHYDVARDQLHWDARLHEMYGLPFRHGIVPPGTWEAHLHPDDRDRVLAKTRQMRQDARDYALDYRICRPNGEIRMIRSRVGFLTSKTDGLRLVGVNWDMTEDFRKTEALEAAHAIAQSRLEDLEQAHQRLEHLTQHDALTGLGNRRKMQATLRHSLSRPRQAQDRIAVLQIDLDRFKEINDIAGHPMGDRLLCAAAGVLETCAPPGATVIRSGGDEFIIILDPAPPEALLTEIAARIIAGLEAIPIDGHGFPPSASIGIAVSDAASSQIVRLFSDADRAMYAAKRAGGGTFVHLGPEGN